MMLRFLLLMLLLENMVESQFNLYDTHQTVDNNSLQSDCLRVYMRGTPFSSTNFEYIINEIGQYCLRPIDMNNLSASNTLRSHHRNLTFKELRHLNVTVEQILLWSAPINLAEQYQDYLNQPISSFASSEIFFNCTKPWFGPRCQYSFVLQEMVIPYDVLIATFEAKLAYIDPHKVTNLTCYIHLKCDRGGPPMCLDWREICNGRIDCLDGGLDEAHCFDLEVNECGEDEFRCYNGICVGEDFWHAGDQSAICPNEPVTPYIDSQLDFCISDPSPRCEDRSCISSKPFPCGDGQCVDDFNACRNGRHHLLTQSISVQGNLLYNCWVAMTCLTKINDQVDGISCENFSASSDFIAFIQSCEPLTQFPTIPVLFGYVSFLYNMTVARNFNSKLAQPPDYVCYDEQLCDFLVPTFRNENNTCRYGYEMGFEQNMKYDNWSSIIHSVKGYFRGCLTRYQNETDLLHSSLYPCKNSSKHISKHRIVDGFSDCYMNDDEEQFELSCSVNDTHRFKCHNEDKCRSPLFSRDTCSTSSKHNLEDILFQEVCDHSVQLLPEMIDAQNHTDETECEYWACNNIYTRCNSFQDCSDGKDEKNCTASICNPPSLLCVDPYNYTVTCLSSDRVLDDTFDCLGAMDEPDLCGNTDLNSQSLHWFWCWNADKCVLLSYLCDGEVDCPFGDDEIFCGTRHDICKENQLIYRNNVEYALCRLGRIDKMYFSLKTSPIYPFLTESKIIDSTDEQPRVQHTIIGSNDKSEHDPAWNWRCNRGLYARYSLTSDYDNFKCFCPPSYYGDFCQYQNQRVFLKLGLSLSDRRAVYAIVVTFINDDERQEVNSYEQFVTVGGQLCGEFVDMYLLYSSRPKNNSKKYSVRIDAFDKASLTYIASWHLSIRFPFLPVNHLGIVINVPSYRAPKPNNCPLQCNNGECVRYTNGKNLFCHCQTGWSGAQCQIPVNCSICSSGSRCIGHMSNRPICVCPLTKFGPRCLLTHSCPENFCHNNGRCIMINPSFDSNGYACICSEQFGGLRCEYRKAKVEIHLNNMEIPSYLFVHTITVNDYQPPVQKVMFKKLLMFQHTVTLYILDDFHIVFLKIASSYYLAVLQQFKQTHLSTSISPAQRCRPVNELLNSTVMAWPKIRQVKYYHIPCQTKLDLLCFFDELYMCLCTLEQHANCFKFDHKPDLTCRDKTHCQHGAECFQDHQLCPLDTLCICTDCYFGDQCQFYAKGIGLTLDDILRYQIRPNSTLADQPVSVKVSAALTMIMFAAGLINSVFSLMTFPSKASRKVGCGVYLLASSITSLLTVTMFTIKFWFLILTQMNAFVSRSVLRGGCISIEPLLKLLLYTGNWLNACVALERAVTVFKGVNFNQSKSKQIARWTILFLPAFTVGTTIHEPLYRDLFDDKEEHRAWCVTNYSHSVQTYNTAILFFHFLVPFFCNLFSALFIIFRVTRHRAKARTGQNYRQHLREQLNEHKQLLISSLIFVVLSLPQLIISLLSGCVKSSRNPWLYLSGYFIAFIPSIIVFAAFVLPSAFYMEQFRESLNNWRRRFHRE